MVFRVFAEMKTQLKVFFFIVGKRVLSLENWGLEIENVFSSVLISKWIPTAPANHSHLHRTELIDFIRNAMEENKMRIENILFMKIRYRYFEVVSNISTGGLRWRADSYCLCVCIESRMESKIRVTFWYI